MICFPDPALYRMIIFNRCCEVVGHFYFRNGSWDLELTNGREYIDFSIPERQFLDDKQAELNT